MSIFGATDTPVSDFWCTFGGGVGDVHPLRFTVLSPNCHSAVQTRTQTQTEPEAHRMHAIWCKIFGFKINKIHKILNIKLSQGCWNDGIFELNKQSAHSIITAGKRSYGKAMFLHLFVSLFTRGCLALRPGGHTPWTPLPVTQPRTQISHPRTHIAPSDTQPGLTHPTHYGQQAGGKHPTGMLSCLELLTKLEAIVQFSISDNFLIYNVICHSCFPENRIASV